MANNKRNSLAIGLSQEELMVILAYLKTNKFLGLEDEDLKAYTSEQINLVMGLAERALIARGFIVRGADGRMELSPLAFSVVGVCAFPDITIIVGQNRPNQLEQNTFFHSARKMNVIHSIPMTFIHQFVAVEERRDLAQALISTLGIDSATVSGSMTATTQMETLGDAREAAEKGDFDKTVTLLTGGGVAKSVAELLAQSLVKPLVNTTVSFIDHKNDNFDGFALLQSEETLWSLKPVEPQNNWETVEIRTASSQDIFKQIKTWMAI